MSKYCQTLQFLFQISEKNINIAKLQNMCTTCQAA